MPHHPKADEHLMQEATELSPAQRGFHMPAEWEHHLCTWLTWPHNEEHWPGKFKKIPSLWAKMTKELVEGEKVCILIHDEMTEQVVKEELSKEDVSLERVQLHRVRNNFSWARDHGPIFVRNAKGEKLILHWQFNAWGHKWPHELDEEIPSYISQITGIPSLRIPMVLEGGSIDVNGKGTLLTTEACLLHENRNPHLTQAQIEERLHQYLGIKKVIWLGDGIVGDDTNGHIDDLTRFVGPSTVVTIIEEDSSDDNYAPLKENLSRLEHMTDQDGNRLEIHTLSLPKAVSWKGQRLPASYSNFYIGNKVVLLPVFKDPHDAKAIETLEKAFPGRKIAAIDARDLVWGLGAFHCITQQQPE